MPGGARPRGRRGRRGGPRRPEARWVSIAGSGAWPGSARGVRTWWPVLGVEVDQGGDGGVGAGSAPPRLVDPHASIGEERKARGRRPAEVLLLEARRCGWRRLGWRETAPWRAQGAARAPARTVRWCSARAARRGQGGRRRTRPGLPRRVAPGRSGRSRTGRTRPTSGTRETSRIEPMTRAADARSTCRCAGCRRRDLVHVHPRRSGRSASYTARAASSCRTWSVRAVPHRPYPTHIRDARETSRIEPMTPRPDVATGCPVSWFAAWK